MDDSQARWPRGGRTLRWRAAMLLAGLLLAGYGVAIARWPRVLSWTVAGVFALLGLVLAASALLARSPRDPGRGGPPREPGA